MTSRTTYPAVFLAAALTLPLAGPAAAQAESAIRWEDYTLRVGDTPHAARLGRLTVPEVRGPAAAGSVELAFVVLPSRSEDPGPPIVYLDGGPGGSGVDIARAPAYFRLFDALRDVADVVLLSQRGTGLSSPRLVCPLAAPLPKDFLTTRQRILEALAPSVQACASTWRERGVDLSGYDTEESADDLESLRRALGAEELSLLGFSYGTHLGLTALRRHGDRIHRAVFIGTEGPDHTLKLPSTGDLQLRHLALLAAGDEAGAAATPDLHAAIDSLLDRLDREPVELPFRANGEADILTLGGDGMRYLLARDLGDTNDLPLWPAAIRLTLDGDHRLLTALAGRRFREVAGVPLMTILVDCASGASPLRIRRIQEEAEEALLGAMTNLWYPEVCGIVPEARLGEDFRSRFISPVPSLFLSGTLDANTPPDQAYQVSWGWPRATHLVVEGAGHESLMPWAPAQEVIVDFLRGEDVSRRDLPSRPLDFVSVERAREMAGG